MSASSAKCSGVIRRVRTEECMICVIIGPKNLVPTSICKICLFIRLISVVKVTFLDNHESGRDYTPLFLTQKFKQFHVLSYH